MAFTHALSTNNYGTAKLIVSTSAANGTHTTLASAMADAVSGDTIFLRDSVTENITLTAGVNIAQWNGGTLNTPTITGTLTMTTAGTCNITGIRLVTNSAPIISVTGSEASIVNISNCYLNISNNTAITFSSSSASAKVFLFNCNGDIGTTGITFCTHSSAGALRLIDVNISNSGASTTASTVSAGFFQCQNCGLNFSLTTSGTAAFGFNHSILDNGANNATALTHGGSGASQSKFSYFSGGTASAISIGATLVLSSCEIGSSNTNCITGAGTINYSGLTFTGSSSTINVTTQNANCGTLVGSKTTAPSVGFLGERITATGSTVALTTTVSKTMASIALTPGVWDITVSASFTNSTAVASAAILSISTVDNTIAGLQGDQINYFVGGVGVVMNIVALVVPAFRVVITANTTYYGVGNLTFASGTASITGRISAVRIA